MHRILPSCILLIGSMYYILSIYFGRFSNSSISSISNRSQHIHPPSSRQKLVFMVIDAMRLDMITNQEYNAYMPFLSSKMREGKVEWMKSIADPPTVTLPRLKALTSGIIPTFFDIISNVVNIPNPNETNNKEFNSNSNKNLINTNKTNSNMNINLDVMHMINFNSKDKDNSKFKGSIKSSIKNDLNTLQNLKETDLLQDKKISNYFLDVDVQNIQNLKDLKDLKSIENKHNIQHQDSSSSYMSFNSSNPNRKNGYFDSWLEQFHEKNASIVLCGDETWLRLFPKSYFKFMDTTTSLFVTDTVQVDRNVTRNLDWILKSEDWNVTILHYLGLDHIGHLGGINHPLLHSKLKELDIVIEKIYTWIIERMNDDTVFILTSDHGTNKDGNHGGASDEETSSFFVIMNKQFDENPSPMKNNLKNFNVPYTVYQRDIVPTLSTLFSLPIPVHSLGNVISPVLKRIGGESFACQSMKQNAQQLALLYNHTCSTLNCHITFDKNGKLQFNLNQFENSDIELSLFEYENSTASCNYSELLIDALTKELLSHSADSIPILRSLLSLILFIVSIFSFKQSFRLKRIIKLRPLFVLILQFTFIYLVQSFVNRCWEYTNLKHLHSIGIQVLPLIFLGAFMINKNGWSPMTRFQCHSLIQRKEIQLNMKKNENILPCLSTIFDNYGSNLTKRILFVFFFVQIIIGLSTSFIEEDHNTWYYMATTLILFAIYWEWKRTKKINYDIIILMFLFKIACLWNPTGIKGINALSFSKLLRTASIFGIDCNFVAMLCTLYPIIQSVNNIRSNLSQFKVIVLNRKTLNSKKVLVDSIWTKINRKSKSWNLSLFIIIANLFTCFSRFGDMYKQTHWIYTIFAPWINFFALACYLILSTYIHLKSKTIQSYCWYIKSIEISFISLQVLLQKSENVPLVILIAIISNLLVKISKRDCFKSLNFERRSLFYIMSISSFYMFGNSISIASFDFSGAYKGSTSFNPWVIGTLVYMYVFVGPILFDLAANSIELKNNYNIQKFTLRGISLAFMTIVVHFMQGHLFIWSVFTPKLLLESLMMAQGFINQLVMYILMRFSK